MKILSKQIVLIAVSILLLSSCQKGLVYDEVPESIYNEVGVRTLNSDAYVQTHGRRIFENNIRQVTHMGKPLATAILVSNLSLNTLSYTNNTSSSMTIGQIDVAPGASVKVQNYIEEVKDSNAPEGTLYVIHAYVVGTTIFKSPNKSNLFDPSTFTAENKPIQYLEEETATNNPGLYNKVSYPTDLKHMVVSILLQEPGACEVYPQNDAPELGKPGDFTAPRRYMVVNENERPDGSGQRKRLYEIRIEVLP